MRDFRGRHKVTGEHAIVKPLPGGLCVAQFDRMSHRHSHGWHLYLRRDFQIVRQREPRTPGAALRLKAHQSGYRWKTVHDSTPRHGSPTARRPTSHPVPHQLP